MKTIRSAPPEIELSLASIASALRSRGFDGATASESSDPSVEDDEVRITNAVHVQVGDTYLIANRWSEEECAMYHGKTRDRSMQGLEGLVLDVRDHLSAAHPSAQ